MASNSDNPCLRFEQNDLELYQGLLADTRQSWECLYLKSYRSFIPYACQRSPISTDDALDILQEGLAEFAVKLKNGRYAFQGKPVTAYVFTVCRNRWVTFLKRNKIQKIDVADDAMSAEESLSDLSEGLPPPNFLSDDEKGERDENSQMDSQGDTSIWDENEVDWEAVARAFAESGDDCQVMLHCFYVEEKSLGECASRIGMQENSAKVKRFRCAQRMKSLYVKYMRNK
ncbi:RNA polymerase sigma factor [Spirosoma gilvum]